MSERAWWVSAYGPHLQHWKSWFDTEDKAKAACNKHARHHKASTGAGWLTKLEWTQRGEAQSATLGEWSYTLFQEDEPASGVMAR